MLEIQSSAEPASQNEKSNDPMKLLSKLASLQSKRKSVNEDGTYLYESALKELLENKSIEVQTKDEEVVGFVVEVRVEPHTVIIDFAGAYFFELPFDQIKNIKFVEENEVEAYCQEIYNTSRNPDYFKAVRKRIEQTLSN